MKTMYVVMVTYTVGPEIGALLDRMVLESRGLKDTALHVLLVDNASPDLGTQKLLSEREGIEIFHVIRNEKNRGFAAGCNTGIAYALSHHADAVLLLNPDTEISEGFFGEMIRETADIWAPVIRFRRNGGWVYDYGGIVNGWTGETRHVEISNNPITQYSTNNPINGNNATMQQCNNKQIDYVSGCCMMIRKDVFDEIGYFDERYFLYFEDVDFCLRAKRAGGIISVVQSCVVTHMLKEGGKKSWKKYQAHLVSALRYIHVWVPWYRRPLAYGYWMVLVVRTFVSIAREEMYVFFSNLQKRTP